MFIPPKDYAQKFKSRQAVGSKVRLHASHLLIDREVVSQVFDEADNVYLVYYPDRHRLLLAPAGDEVFKNLHKAGQHILKARNAKGDRSLALHEILIDNQIDNSNRELVFDIQAGLGILNVQL